jgi:beta-glucanase (GH16 family)
MAKRSSLVQSLAAVLLLAGAKVQAGTVSGSVEKLHESHVARATFRDDFNSFNEDVWKCEYTCPVIEAEKARFRLKSGVEPDNYGSWSKASYEPQRFTSGRFTVSFSLTERLTKQAAWWSVALWDATYGEDQFNEINFGYMTDESLPNTTFRFESARRGNDDYREVNVGFNVYDESYHNATLEYDSTRVAFYFDDEPKAEITDQQYIPTDPMDFILGPHLVTGSEPLAEGFAESIDWVEIEY